VQIAENAPYPKFVTGTPILGFFRRRLVRTGFCCNAGFARSRCSADLPCCKVSPIGTVSPQDVFAAALPSEGRQSARVLVVGGYGGHGPVAITPQVIGLQSVNGDQDNIFGNFVRSSRAAGHNPAFRGWEATGRLSPKFPATFLADAADI
jgi:hypothetical protein